MPICWNELLSIWSTRDWKNLIDWFEQTGTLLVSLEHRWGLTSPLFKKNSYWRRLAVMNAFLGGWRAFANITLLRSRKQRPLRLQCHYCETMPTKNYLLVAERDQLWEQGLAPGKDPCVLSGIFKFRGNLTEVCDSPHCAQSVWRFILLPERMWCSEILQVWSMPTIDVACGNSQRWICVFDRSRVLSNEFTSNWRYWVTYCAFSKQDSLELLPFRFQESDVPPTLHCRDRCSRLPWKWRNAG